MNLFRKFWIWHENLDNFFPKKQSEIEIEYEVSRTTTTSTRTEMVMEGGTSTKTVTMSGSGGGGSVVMEKVRAAVYTGSKTILPMGQHFPLTNHDYITNVFCHDGRNLATNLHSRKNGLNCKASPNISKIDDQDLGHNKYWVCFINCAIRQYKFYSYLPMNDQAKWKRAIKMILFVHLGADCDHYKWRRRDCNLSWDGSCCNGCCLRCRGPDCHRKGWAMLVDPISFQAFFQLHDFVWFLSLRNHYFELHIYFDLIFADFAIACIKLDTLISQFTGKYSIKCWYCNVHHFRQRHPHLQRQSPLVVEGEEERWVKIKNLISKATMLHFPIILCHSVNGQKLVDHLVWPFWITTKFYSDPGIGQSRDGGDQDDKERDHRRGWRHHNDCGEHIHVGRWRCCWRWESREDIQYRCDNN